MNRPFFTVVMPAYGVEKYLEKAVKSIVAQTIFGLGTVDCGGRISG